MKSKISIERNEDHLYFTYIGKYDFDELMSCLKLIQFECNEKHFDKALLNLLEMEGAMTGDIERFYLGVEVSQLFGYKIKFAYVSQEQYMNRYGEMVAINRGAYTQVFEDLDEAREWLLNDED